MKENKNKKLGPQEVRENIAFKPLDKFLIYFNCAKKDDV